MRYCFALHALRCKSKSSISQIQSASQRHVREGRESSAGGKAQRAAGCFGGGAPTHTLFGLSCPCFLFRPWRRERQADNPSVHARDAQRGSWAPPSPSTPRRPTAPTASRFWWCARTRAGLLALVACRPPPTARRSPLLCRLQGHIQSAGAFSPVEQHPWRNSETHSLMHS